MTGRLSGKMIFLYWLLALFTGTISFAESANSLKIAGYSDSPPFSFVGDKGKADGILVDFWNSYGNAEKIKIDFKLTDPNNALNMVVSGEADLLLGDYFSAELDQQLDFTTPFMNIPICIFVKESMSGITFKELSNSKIGLVDHKQRIAFLQENYPGIKLELFTSENQLYQALKKGRIQVFIDDQLSAAWQLGKMEAWDDYAVYEHLYDRHLRAAVKDGNSTLLKSLETGLAGPGLSKYDDLFAKWAATPPPSGGPSPANVIIIAVLLVVIIAMSALVFSQSNKLKAGAAQLHETKNQVKFKEEAVKREVEERRLTENALRDARERYRVLAEAAQDVILTCNLDGRITFLNHAGYQLSGVTEGAITNLKLSDLLPEKHCTLILERFAKDPRTQEDIPYLEAALNTDKGVIQVEMHVSPIRAGKTVTGMLVIARDITLRKSMEGEKIAKANLKAVQNLARAVAHEFRQPMTTLHLIAQLVDQGGVDSDTVRRIPKLVDRLDNLVKRLLKINEVTTKSYMGEFDILDIDASSEPEFPLNESLPFETEKGDEEKTQSSE